MGNGDGKKRVCGLKREENMVGSIKGDLKTGLPSRFIEPGRDLGFERKSYVAKYDWTMRQFGFHQRFGHVAGPGREREMKDTKERKNRGGERCLFLTSQKFL